MYKINRIRLKKFSGMWLKEIEMFDMRTRAAAMIILGRNGCGKTRLLSILFPVCPAKTDFQDGGEYLNESEIDGVAYQFIVRRTGNQMKCTIKNITKDIMVVKNVNPKVYNAKVDDLLGIDREIRELLIGETKLTTMSIGARRSWFTRLSTSDLSYALGVYKKLKDHNRDLTGAIKHGQQKIADIKPRVVECEKERNTLKQRLLELQKEVEDLGAEIKAVVSDPTITKDVYFSTLDKLNVVSMKIVERDNVAIQNIEELDARIAAVGTQLGEATARVEHTQQTLGSLLERKQRYDYIMANSAGLESQVKELRAYLDGELAENVYYRDLLDFDRFTSGDLGRGFNFINEFSTDLTRWVDGLKTTATFENLSKELATYTADIADTENKLGKVDIALGERKHRLDHFNGTQAVDCPKCHTTFKPGLFDVSAEKIEADIAQLEEVKKKGEFKLADLQGKHKVILEQHTLLEQIQQVCISYSKDPVLSVLFTTLHSEDAFVSNRGKFAALVNTFVSELESAIKVSRQNDIWVKKNAQLEQVKAESNVDLGDIDKEIEETQTLLEHQNEYVTATNGQLTLLNNLKKDTLEMVELSNMFNTLMASAEEQANTYLKNMYRDHLTEKRQQVWDTYSLANTRFNEMDEEFRRLAAIEEEVEELQKRQTAAQLLVRTMSPEKGMLRNYFYQSISRITDMMSKHIAQVWQYPLIVQPCNIEDTDLDYKFPFINGDVTEPIPDVKNGSAAQREMFNLAFRLTAYKALGLEGFPIILDEPGATYDEGHRDSLVDFIKALLETGQHSQAFIVSHNSDVHSRLNEADFCVISEDGVSLPPVYNERVKIKTRG